MFPKILAVRHHRHTPLDLSVSFVPCTPPGRKQKADLLPPVFSLEVRDGKIIPLTHKAAHYIRVFRKSEFSANSGHNDLIPEKRFQ
jgi:hypothetical protein